MLKGTDGELQLLTLLGVLLGALGLSVVGTRMSMSVAQAWGILDLPSAIKPHSHPVTRFGGTAIVCATFLAVVVFGAGTQLRVLPFFIGGCCIALVGAVDDIFGLRPLHKFSGVVLASVVFGVLSESSLSCESRLLFQTAGVVLFVCFMSNAVNLLDGMDGLAGGTVSIMAVCLAFLALTQGLSALGILLVALAGACLGFMLYNIPPASTFMGDTGSLFLGYIIGAGAVQIALSSPMSLPRFLGVSLVVLVPASDTVLAVLRRVKNRRNLFAGDRSHFYDQIYKRSGRSIWKMLIIIWGLTASSGILGVLVSKLSLKLGAVVAAIVLAVMLVLAIGVGVLNQRVNSEALTREQELPPGT